MNDRMSPKAAELTKDLEIIQDLARRRGIVWLRNWTDALENGTEGHRGENQRSEDAAAAYRGLDPLDPRD